MDGLLIYPWSHDVKGGWSLMGERTSCSMTVNSLLDTLSSSWLHSLFFLEVGCGKLLKLSLSHIVSGK